MLDNLPERYGKHKSVHKRFVRWAEAMVWDRLFADRVKDPHPYLMLDFTIVRAHQQATKGTATGGEHKALEQSRGGLSTKIRPLANGMGEPVAFRTHGGAGVGAC